MVPQESKVSQVDSRPECEIFRISPKKREENKLQKLEDALRDTRDTGQTGERGDTRVRGGTLEIGGTGKTGLLGPTVLRHGQKCHKSKMGQLKVLKTERQLNKLTRLKLLKHL